MLTLPSQIDSTMISCYRQCPQKFFREFCQGYRPPGLSLDLHAGGCFATTLEAVYRQIHLHKRSFVEALLIAQGVFMTAWGDYEIPTYKRTAKTKDRVWEAIVGDGTPDGRGYFEVYPPLTDHVQPYIRPDGTPTFEYTFAIPLLPTAVSASSWGVPGHFPSHPNGDPFIYCGRFDMLGSYLGRPCVRDEKTSGKNPEAGPLWSEQWDLRSQFIGYVWACQQLGFDLDTVIVRGIGILKTKIGHMEAIKTYSDFVIARWHEQLRRDLWRMRRNFDENYFDFNLADACTQYGSCVFLPVCQSQQPESWLNNFEVRHWNPLDRNPVNEAA